jgi:5-oxoprolinase (ATP-hydrolysing)
MMDRALDGDAITAARALADDLAADALAELGGSGEIAVHLRLRYAGTDTALSVLWGDEAAMRAAFAAQHMARFGYIQDQRPIIISEVLVEARLEAQVPPSLPVPSDDAASPLAGSTSGAGVKACPRRSMRVRQWAWAR